jgi:hypothetical protein
VTVPGTTLLAEVDVSVDCVAVLVPGKRSVVLEPATSVLVAAALVKVAAAP